MHVNNSQVKKGTCDVLLENNIKSIYMQFSKLKLNGNVHNS